MSQLSSDELALTQAWLPLAAEVAQATDRSDLERRCALALAQILPGAACWLHWDDEPGATSPDQAALARLRRGEILAGDMVAPGYVPIRCGGKLCGWISALPGIWSSEQDQALLLLAAITGTAHAALDSSPPSFEAELRQRTEAALDALRDLLQPVELLDQLCALVQAVCAPCTVGIVLRYKQSPWLQLASLSEQGQARERSSFWSQNAGLSGEVIASGEAIFAESYFAECARRDLQPVIYVSQQHLGAWMGAPLRAGPAIIGAINVMLEAAGASFSPLQRELFLLIARESSRPLQNALRYQRAEQQARQLAALNQIVRTINSSLDPEQVPALIIEQAEQLLEAEEGTLLLLDEQTGELIFSYASGPAGQQLLGQRLPPGRGIAGNVVASGQATISNDTRSDGRFYGDADARAGFTTRSLIAVPLRGIDGIKGVIEVVNRRDNAPFTDEDKDLLEAVADQAVIALENARRFARVDQALARRAQELDRSNNQLRKILRVSHAMRADRRLEDLLRQIADAVVESAGFRSAIIALVQRERTPEPYLQRTVAAGPPAALLDRMRAARAPLDRLLAIMRPEYRRGSLTYMISAQQSDYVDLWGGRDQVYLSNTPALDRPGTWQPGDVLFSLLRDSHGKLLGTLRVDDPEDGMQPSHEQLQILEIFANQAAVAIESAHLYSEQQHSLQSMTALNGLGMAINSTLRSPEQIYELTASGMLAMTDARWALVLLGESSELAPAFQTDGLPSDLTPVVELASEAVRTRRPNLRPSAIGGEACVAIPLRATRRVLGAICVGYAEGPPGPTDLETLSLFANQAAVAVESVELLVAVRQGRDQLASIMASTQEGMLLIDRVGQVAVANAAFHKLSDAGQWAKAAAAPTALADLPLADLLARWQAQASFPAPERELLAEGLSSVADGRERQALGELNARDGQALEWTVLRAASEGSPESAAGERWPILLTLRDITAAKETERLRQDLSSMIVHDLRSPLTSIMTSIEMFFRGVTGDVSGIQREILSIAYASTQHLLNMVNLLLDISRLEGGRMPLDRALVAPDDLARRAISRLSIIAQSHEITIEEQLAKGQLVFADGELVLRVLQNLLDNALKFSPRGGRVVVCAEPVAPSGAPGPQTVTALGQARGASNLQREICFAVRDFGIGIKAQDLEKIFQKFGQAGNRRNSGSGLGLTFCKLVIEAHGGRIWVESTPGAGSTFCFTLPTAVTAVEDH